MQQPFGKLISKSIKYFQVSIVCTGMERNYSTSNVSAEQRLTLAIIKVIRHLSTVINRIITKLENQKEWFAAEMLYSQPEEINQELTIAQNARQVPAENKMVTNGQTDSSNETTEWQYPVLTRKRSKAQLSLDYLLAISG